MNKKYYNEAESLSKRPYQTQVFRDETTDGEAIYVAVVPEMPGCIAHGDSVEEALEWLESAKLDHIWFLLDKNMDVPEPKLLNSGMVFNAPDNADTDSAYLQAFGGFVAPAVTA